MTSETMSLKHILKKSKNSKRWSRDQSSRFRKRIKKWDRKRVWKHMISIKRSGSTIWMFLSMPETSKTERSKASIINSTKNRKRMTSRCRIGRSILKQMTLRCRMFSRKYSRRILTKMQPSGSARSDRTDTTTFTTGSESLSRWKAKDNWRNSRSWKQLSRMKTYQTIKHFYFRTVPTVKTPMNKVKTNLRRVSSTVSTSPWKKDQETNFMTPAAMCSTQRKPKNRPEWETYSPKHSLPLINTLQMKMMICHLKQTKEGSNAFPSRAQVGLMHLKSIISADLKTRV